MSGNVPAFECRRCGHCCQGQGGIILADKDIRRLLAHLGLDREDFLAAAAETKAGHIRLRSGPDGYCVYYSHEIPGCGVHPARPDICRAWPFFRGNMVDASSWEMIQDYCPGVNPAVSHGEFTRQGRIFLREGGLVAEGEDVPSALRPE